MDHEAHQNLHLFFAKFYELPKKCSIERLGKTFVVFHCINNFNFQIILQVFFKLTIFKPFFQSRISSNIQINDWEIINTDLCYRNKHRIYFQSKKKQIKSTSLEKKSNFSKNAQPYNILLLQN